ncbi:hypothetical protein [Sphingobium algorifonticola]|uniref:Anti-sigma factor NepR domain-containing protein n=1 Tax=Sphingobium algorifonticola TaxID=2008318 RepID=A0A437J9F1_9SPHN|nr:hypothetical protein [Sphingobium algorifonticola]RVT42127.1 hypothetical protein ENE74_07840 [Sphingobium algorifonticola]
MVEQASSGGNRTDHRQTAGHIFVQAPSARDGVAKALNRSFDVGPATVPEDMLALLARLDAR